MIFHSDKEFEDAIEYSSEYFKMLPFYIEKDYWVTMVLKNLSASDFREQVVFKGGTSLSKAFNCIERFSDDIDLALINAENHSDDKCKKIMKSIEAAVTKGLVLIPDHPSQAKFGRNRKTFYKYPAAISPIAESAIKDSIQLEINTLTDPIPHTIKSIQSYLGIFLSEKGFGELVEKHQLQSFQLLVLNPERTFFEKLLSVIRLSYEGIEKLKEKIRHLYDLYMLSNYDELKTKILTEEGFSILDLALKDDSENPTFNKGEWLKNPLSASPFFKDIESVWKELALSYNNELKKLIWHNNLPSSEEIISLLKKIKIFLEEYDTKNPPAKR